jgi:hypothetical protein
MSSAPQPRKTFKTSDSLNRQLNTYALVASAAGVSMLALAGASEAKVVYTKTHQVTHTGFPYTLISTTTASRILYPNPFSAPANGSCAAGSVGVGNIPIVPAAWQSWTNFVQSVDYNMVSSYRL